jgi:hypothetical protein
MNSLTRQYSAAASQARDAAGKTADYWTQRTRTLTQNTRTLAGWLPEVRQVDLVPAVERYFDFVQRTVEANRRVAVKVARAAGTLPVAARDRAGLAGQSVREKATAAEQAFDEHTEKAAHELAREARKVEREQGRRAQAKAREPYEGLTKAELSDRLAKRGLPKSGTVEELIERLAEADSK